MSTRSPRELIGRGHELRVLAPDRSARPPQPGASPWPSREPAELPDVRDRLSRTKAFGANGSVSNIGIFPDGVTKMRRELRDVRSRRRPRPRAAGRAAELGRVLVPRRAGGRDLSRLLDQAAAQPRRHARRRAPQVQPARRPDRRLRGGRLDRAALVRRRLRDRSRTASTSTPPRRRRSPPTDELRLIFVGRPEERKGLPVLLTAFEALVEHVDARLTVVGADRDDVGATSPTRTRGADRRARPGRATTSSGGACTAPTCSARRRSPGRASAWS